MTLKIGINGCGRIGRLVDWSRTEPLEQLEHGSTGKAISI